MNALGNGYYISIQNRADKKTTAYDRQFQPVLTGLKDVKTPYYQVNNYQIISKITSKAIASGFTEVSEATLPNRTVLIASAVGMDGKTVQAILDTDGNELMPAEYIVVTIDVPYVVVANASDLRGLYSLAEHRLVRRRTSHIR